MDVKIFGFSSWMYRFLAWPSGYISPNMRPQTICELRGAILGKMAIWITLVSMLLGYVSSITYSLLYHFTCGSRIATTCTYGYNIVVEVGLVMMLITGGCLAFLAFAVLVVKCYDLFTSWKYDRKHSGKQFISDDNPMKLMWESAVEKICYSIKFEYDEE